MKELSKTQLRKFVQNKVEANAFIYLSNKKLGHKKVKRLKHESLKMAEYLKQNYQNIKLKDAQLLLHLKTKMVHVKANYSRSFGEI